MDPLDPFADLLDLDEAGPIKEYLSVPDLQRLCGRDDIENAPTLETQIDAVKHNVQRLGERMPRLVELKLTGSYVSRLSDLGTRLQGLTVLWLGRSGVEQLGGTNALPNLEELYLSYNKIADLSPLASLTRLRVLDVEGNKVADPETVMFLQSCPELHSLTLEQNPIAGKADYREVVAEMLPTLEYLDDVPLDGSVDADPLAAVMDVELDTEVLRGIEARLDDEVRSAITARGMSADPCEHSDRVRALLEEQRSNVPLTTDLFMDDREKVRHELKAVVTAVKNAQFRDPCLMNPSLTGSDSDSDGSASDEDAFNYFSDEGGDDDDGELQPDDEYERRMLDSIETQLRMAKHDAVEGAVVSPGSQGNVPGGAVMMGGRGFMVEDEEMLTPRARSDDGDDDLDAFDEDVKQTTTAHRAATVAATDVSANKENQVAVGVQKDNAAGVSKDVGSHEAVTPPRPPSGAAGGKRLSSRRDSSGVKPLGSLLERLEGGSGGGVGGSSASAPRRAVKKRRSLGGCGGIRSAADFKEALLASQRIMQMQQQQQQQQQAGGVTSPNGVASPESHLTYHTSTVFCGNATRSLLSHRQSDPVSP